MEKKTQQELVAAVVKLCMFARKVGAIENKAELDWAIKMAKTMKHPRSLAIDILNMGYAMNSKQLIAAAEKVLRS